VRLGGSASGLFGANVKVTPDIDCRIVGEVTRGRLALSGSGERLTISLPVNATVAARDVGGILKGKTATASGIVRADVSFALDRNWNASAKVDISYDWREPPGIDFLGQRIEFMKRPTPRWQKSTTASSATCRRKCRARGSGRCSTTRGGKASPSSS
jgi:hypothetical protein